MGLFSSAPDSHFPLARGRRLDGTDVELPQDLPADATLLVVAFEDALDPLADQWARLGDRLVGAHGGRFAVLETPVVSKKMKLLGDLGTIGIRGQIDDEVERERTVPIYVDPKKLRKALKLDKGDVTALLVARDGRIAWRGEGDIDMDEVAELEEAVAELLAAPVPDPSAHPDLDGPPSDEAPDDDDEASDDDQAPASDEPTGDDDGEVTNTAEPPTGDGPDHAESDSSPGATTGDDPPRVTGGPALADDDRQRGGD